MIQLAARFFFIVTLAVALACASPLRAHADDAAPAKADKADKAEPPKEAPKKEDGGGESKKPPDDVSGGRFQGDPVYVHLAPMILPVISDAGAEQLVTLIVDVQVKDFNVADTMHANMPKVQDALMRALYGGLGTGTLRNGKLIDVNKIKAKITAALGEVIEGDGVREVLIQGVAQRML